MAALIRQAALQLSRLSVGGSSCRGIMTQTGPLAFRATQPLGGEPLKRRKKMDITLVIQRETRKRKKLEKAIRHLEKKGRVLKPIDEIEGERSMLKTLDIRQRKAPVGSFEESEARVLLHKQWTRYKFKQHTTEKAAIYTALNCQQRALEELRAESEELYQAAIELDTSLIPFERSGPVRTPPIDKYETPDGEYTDTTKIFDK